MKIINYFIGSFYINYAYFLIRFKKYEKAKNLLEKTMKLNVHKHLVYNNLAVIAFLHDKDLKEGARCLEVALKAKPKFYILMINLSYLYIKLEQYDMALDVIEKAEKSWPLRAFAYNNRAVVLIRLKKYEEALEWAKKSLKKNRWLHIARYNIGTAHVELGNYPEAIKDLELAFKKGKEPKYLYSLAYAYMANKEYIKSLETLKKIKQATQNFFEYSAGKKPQEILIKYKGKDVALNVGGKANLIAYVGHDGLMDFDLDNYPTPANKTKREAVVLACYSKRFFTDGIKTTGVTPILLTNGKMAPEAYVLEAAISAWIKDQDVRDAAATSYAKYQKISKKAGLGLFAKE